MIQPNKRQSLLIVLTVGLLLAAALLYALEHLKP